MGDAFKYVLLLCILFIGTYAFFSVNSIIQLTQPVDNSSFLANQSTQTSQIIDLTGALLPGLLLLAGAFVVYKIFGSG